MKNIPSIENPIASAKAFHRLEGVIQSYGAERMEGLCPFHSDTHPSLNVYRQMQHYRCYACNTNGDSIDFAQQYAGCSFFEALARLGKKPEGTRSQPIRQHDAVPRGKAGISLGPPQSLLHLHTAILTQAQAIYHQVLYQVQPILDSVQTRGITKEGIDCAGLGYADGSTFRAIITQHDSLWQQARAAGLIPPHGQEWLRGRLIIPDFVASQCVWMIGRSVPTLAGPTIYPGKKYLGLSLPKPLGGYDAALTQLQNGEARFTQSILTVEGALDYVIARQWDLLCLPTALIGTYASAYQLRCLFHPQKVSRTLPFLVWHDDEERGGQATLVFFDQLRGHTARAFPPLLGYKDLAEVAASPHGYALLKHTWHGLGEGEAQ